MDYTECVICLNDISICDLFILTCCKNHVHIYCLNDWVSKNITNKNISKCFICSQENSMIETMVLYNKSSFNNNGYIVPINSNETSHINRIHPINHDANINSIIMNNNTNTELVLVNDTIMMDISHNIDKRLYYIYSSIKILFLILVSVLVIFVLFFII